MKRSAVDLGRALRTWEALNRPTPVAIRERTVSELQKTTVQHNRRGRMILQHSMDFTCEICESLTRYANRAIENEN